MSTPVDRREFDDIPDESTIATLREEAADHEVSIEASYSTTEGDQKRLVVSPRGTVVVLNDVSEETFNRSVGAAEIAAHLRA